MHAEILALLTKPLYFPNIKYLNYTKVVVMVTRYFFKNILTNEKSPKNIYHF